MKRVISCLGIVWFKLVVYALIFALIVGVVSSTWIVAIAAFVVLIPCALASAVMDDITSEEKVFKLWFSLVYGLVFVCHSLFILYFLPSTFLTMGVGFGVIILWSVMTGLDAANLYEAYED